MSISPPDLSEVQVVITYQLATQGERHICTRCPVALAINQHLRSGVRSRVGATTFSLETTNDGFDFDLPEDAKEFIFRFDRQLPISFPVLFPLSLPKRLLRESSDYRMTDETTTDRR